MRPAPPTASAAATSFALCGNPTENSQGRDLLNALHIEEETMHKGSLGSRFTISTVLLLGLVFSNSAFAEAGGKPATEIESMGPVPKAQCGPSDRTESGLQGQTTSQERASGDSERGYNCNLELVGQFRGEGAFSQNGPAYFAHCAYMATENNPQQSHPGIVVIDVSDPRNPHATALSLRKTLKRRERLAILAPPPYRGGHDHDHFCLHLAALVPLS
jgi:hypothetical protein